MNLFTDVTVTLWLDTQGRTVNFIISDVAGEFWVKVFKMKQQTQDVHTSTVAAVQVVEVLSSSTDRSIITTNTRDRLIISVYMSATAHQHWLQSN